MNLSSITRSAPMAAPSAGPARGLVTTLFGDDGFSFKDVLDLVNPLQHIPVVGNLYRKLTGDVIAPAIRLAGGALFGGPVGAALSAVGLMVESNVNSTRNEPDAASLVADATMETPRRGGWIVNAALTGKMPTDIPVEVGVSTDKAIARTDNDSSAPRRGGWIVAQAYAMEDFERAARERSTPQIADKV